MSQQNSKIQAASSSNQQSNQSPHWADTLIKGIIEWAVKKKVKKFHVDDMKTPSGRVHTGSLRGAVLHDLVYKVLASHSPALKQKLASTFVINDMDPMDGLPHYLDAQVYGQYMGMPLYKIPAPPLEKSGIDFAQASEKDRERFQKAKSFGEFYALDFVDAIRVLGCTQKIIWSHELYEAGEMDDVIKEALDKVDKIRQVYKQVADYDLPKNWHPFQVICPKCGKVGTTLVTAWDGKEATFECQPNKVDWAQGCGHQGKISPFGGTGKLLWKVDWPAHWKTIGVTIEGSGKDHCSAGGSKDMGDTLCREVFNYVEPFNIPYEWFVLRGKKMSSSKGVGTSAREFVELLPPVVGRFLFTHPHYNSVIDFDPRTDAIPDLFDAYDQGARIYWGEEKGDVRMARAFELSQLEQNEAGQPVSPAEKNQLLVPKAHFLPRFRDVTLWMQHPEIDLEEKFAEVKGSALTAAELAVLAERKKYAQIWLNRYAPEDYNLQPKEEMPAAARDLTAEQKKYLQEVLKLVESKKDWDPQDLQQQLFDLAKASLGARPAFQAIYLAFIGRKAGPRAAWFLLSIDENLLKKRIAEIINLD